MLPVLAAQGMRVRRSILRLPPAAPPHHGAIRDREGSLSTAEEQRAFHLFITGESSAAGVGVESHADALSGRLAHRLGQELGTNVCWQALGRNGIKASELREEILPESLLPALKNGPSDLIVISLGVNDVKGLTSRKSWRRDINGIIDDIRYHSRASILLTGLPPVNKFAALPDPLKSVLGARARLLDADLAWIAHQRKTVFHIPMSMELADGSLARDGFHPSEKGYDLWAQNLSLGYLQYAADTAG
ncbi:MAG: SGNH/GDSL hydrolase family protein [Endozoicomonas sp.]